MKVIEDKIKNAIAPLYIYTFYTAVTESVSGQRIGIKYGARGETSVCSTYVYTSLHRTTRTKAMLQLLIDYYPHAY